MVTFVTKCELVIRLGSFFWPGGCGALSRRVYAGVGGSPGEFEGLDAGCAEQVWLGIRSRKDVSIRGRPSLNGIHLVVNE